MARVRHQDHQSGPQARAQSAVYVLKGQRGGVQILRIRVVRHEISVFVVVEHAVAGEEHIDDVFGPGLADQPGVERCVNGGVSGVFVFQQADVIRRKGAARRCPQKSRQVGRIAIREMQLRRRRQVLIG